ncbi:Oidioi.mRNA.OKI2018_I69.chr2.g5031.t1.cds [Oikopleura dioica]|uniref:Oidioi.mRNA.OKI2018_I69.chr2.g5031.t1.cds n=1 Tax=Oikopleura dioica TaxID=34765 RepID=A0ABN7T0U4_OIKDI|nr:Oidioi.mRNA.OKI2018_I69.chr2.g5031.t1.cds [Oikopleura dioica]
MRRLNFFGLLACVQGSATFTETFKCVSETYGKFGDLNLGTFEEKTCEEILSASETETPETIFSGCVVAHPDGSDGNPYTAIEEITCTVENAVTISSCPASPFGCSDGKADDADLITSCVYECSGKLLSEFSCPNSHQNPIDAAETVTDTIFCFDAPFNGCNKKIIDSNTTNQISHTCQTPSCGYKSGEEYTLTFDGSSIVNTYTKTGDGDALDEFGCTGGFTSSGCSCTDPSGKVATMTCSAASYTNECADIEQCVKNTCYEGKPILDYKQDNCKVSNDGYGFCEREKIAQLPCGARTHTCDKKTNNEIVTYQCECAVADSDECLTIPGAKWETEARRSLKAGEKCLIKNLPVEKEMDTCTKTCFDRLFEVKECKNTGGEFVAQYWQCFDEFTIVKDETKSDSEYFKLAEAQGSYSDIVGEGCTEDNKCENGNCICNDDLNEIAKSHCGNNHYVLEKQTSVLSDEETDQTPEYKSLEYQCLSFSTTKNSYDVIAKEPTDTHSCEKLEPPKPNETVKCPDECTAEKDETKERFFECSCETRCSYGCGNDKYKGVFDEKIFGKDFDEETSPIVYDDYTCEKDNLVMIICTSIFVPLGVFGIAGGVYFFFFYESSEVAPVETDNELGSSSDKTEIKEDDKTENQSEIQETTEETN